MTTTVAQWIGPRVGRRLGANTFSLLPIESLI